MSAPRFQQLALTEFDTAYTLVASAAEWLHTRNVPAWLIPLEVYYARHIAGENYGLFVDGMICAVVTLTTYQPPDWSESITHQNFTWLATLASSRMRSQHRYGKYLVQLAEQYIATQHKSAIYLDCYYSNGKLPQLYQQLGYQWLSRKELVFEDGSIHDSVLMRKVLSPLKVSHDDGI